MLSDLDFALSYFISLYQPDANLILSPFALLLSLVTLLLATKGDIERCRGMVARGKTNLTIAEDYLESLENETTLRMEHRLFTSARLPLSEAFDISSYRIVSEFPFAVSKDEDEDSPFDVFAKELLVDQINGHLAKIGRAKAQLALLHVFAYATNWTDPFSDTLSSGHFYPSAYPDVGPFEMQFLISQRSADYFEDKSSGLKALKLPLGLEGKESLILVLPSEDRPFWKFIKTELTVKFLSRLLVNFNSKTLVEIRIPKFSLLQTHSEMAYTKKTLKVKDIFAGKAPFAKLIKYDQGWKVKPTVVEMLQTVDFSMFEGVPIARKRRHQDGRQLNGAFFTADRPFLFFTLNQTGKRKYILAMGVFDQKVNAQE